MQVDLWFGGYKPGGQVRKQFANFIALHDKFLLRFFFSAMRPFANFAVKPFDRNGCLHKFLQLRPQRFIRAEQQRLRG